MYPALAVLDALTKKHSDVEVLWVGGEGGMEAGLVKRAGVPFKEIPAAGLHGVGLTRLPGNALKIIRGIRQSQRILADFQPDAMFFTGGFVAFPMAWAGRGIPSLLYVPDVEPGMALNALARFASTIALTSEESRTYFKDQTKLAVTGYPVRPNIGNITRAKARQQFGITAGDEKKVLLVFGGSKGARSINQALMYRLTEILPLAEVIHISGELDWPQVSAFRASLPVALRDAYHAYPYLHEEMGAAMAAADLVVSRAGASSLGEFPHFGLPAVLVPYPYAWRYQKVNADSLATHGAAEVLEDGLLQSSLGVVVKNLLTNRPKLAVMKRAMERLNKPNAASDIAELLYGLPEAKRA